MSEEVYHVVMIAVYVFIAACVVLWISERR